MAAAFDFLFCLDPAPPDDDVASERASIELGHDAMPGQHLGHLGEFRLRFLVEMIRRCGNCHHRLWLGLVHAVRTGRALDQLQMCWQRLAAGHVKTPCASVAAAPASKTATK